MRGAHPQIITHSHAVKVVELEVDSQFEQQQPKKKRKKNAKSFKLLPNNKNDCAVIEIYGNASSFKKKIVFRKAQEEWPVF